MISSMDRICRLAWDVGKFEPLTKLLGIRVCVCVRERVVSAESPALRSLLMLCRKVHWCSVGSAQGLLEDQILEFRKPSLLETQVSLSS